MTMKEARIEAGITQQELAKLLRVSKRTIEEWEAGNRNPKGGYGKIIHRIKIAGHLTAEGREALAEGEMTWNEADASYKFQTVKQLSRWGVFGDTFAALWGMIPEEVEETCSVEALTELINNIKATYDDGVEHGKKGEM